jgi:hypothetical protein
LGSVKGSISWVEFKVDDRTVIKHDLDKHFGSHELSLPKGDHTFEFVARVRASDDVLVSDNCQGTLSVSGPSTFQPRVVFEEHL